jgi:hypothetical protein
MQKARNITVAVSPELYRQTRRLATDYDTTVPDGIPDRFRFPLLVLLDAVKEARFPGGRPQFARAMARRDQAAKMSAQTPPNSPQEPRNEFQKSPLYSCKTHLTNFPSTTCRHTQPQKCNLSISVKRP